MCFRKNNNVLMVEIATEFKEGIIFSETKNGKVQLWSKHCLDTQNAAMSADFYTSSYPVFWHCSIFPCLN